MSSIIEEIGRSTLFAPEDPSFNVVKQKWTLLLDRLEFEVFVNRSFRSYAVPFCVAHLIIFLV